jgi:hypothetical protein
VSKKKLEAKSLYKMRGVQVRMPLLQRESLDFSDRKPFINMHLKKGRNIRKWYLRFDEAIIVKLNL